MSTHNPVIADSTSGLVRRVRGKGLSIKAAAAVIFQHWEKPVLGSDVCSRKIPFEHECDKFDYIIVGGGPAGSIVANTLAENDPACKILILEAGEAAPDTPLINEPKYWTKIQEDPTLEWGYISTYQKGLYGRAIPLPRSKGLGGCTIHNSLMWVRGGKESYNNWEKAYGCKGWGWNDVLPYFKELEKEITVVVGDPAKDDPWTVALLGAGTGSQLGMPVNPNFNNDLGNEKGVSYNQYTIKHHKRENIYDVYIKGKYVPNVTVLCNTFVSRVLLKTDEKLKKAYGVEFRSANEPGGPVTVVHARKEIIMTAGVFGTPQILMRSGIGIKKDLKEAGISCILDMPGMGQSLCDDLFIAVTYKTELELPGKFVDYGIGGVIMFPEKNNIEITVQSNMMPGLYNIPDDWKPGFQVGADCHKSKSRGYMKLDPKNVEGLPIIEMNYLAEEEDLEQCIEAVRQVRQIGSSNKLKDWKPTEVMPGPKVQTREEIAVFVRGTAISTMHPSGTCRMGAQGLDTSKMPPVVDPSTLKVYGCEGLRIMDNSAFPDNPHGNPAAAVFVIALKGANMIIAESAKKQT